jgi:two-component system sensor histidine kinase VicK
VQGAIGLQLELAAEPGYVQLAVADSGVGIAAEDQAKIFDRFFRTDAGRLVDASGAGLGLHITRSLVELHGGRIWLTSDVGKGTTIWVTFPAILPATSEAQ